MGRDAFPQPTPAIPGRGRAGRAGGRAVVGVQGNRAHAEPASFPPGRRAAAAMMMLGRGLDAR